MKELRDLVNSTKLRLNQLKTDLISSICKSSFKNNKPPQNFPQSKSFLIECNKMSRKWTVVLGHRTLDWYWAALHSTVGFTVCHPTSPMHPHLILEFFSDFEMSDYTRWRNLHIVLYWCLAFKVSFSHCCDWLGNV